MPSGLQRIEQLFRQTARNLKRGVFQELRDVTTQVEEIAQLQFRAAQAFDGLEDQRFCTISFWSGKHSEIVGLEDDD